MSSLTDWVCWIKVLLLPVFVLLIFKIELNCVVTSSDSFDIPVNILGLLNTLDVVEVDHSEEIDENGDAADEKTEDLSESGVFGWDSARSLDVEEGFVATESIISNEA